MEQLNYDLLLCDLDAFYASVEQLDNPKIKGRPVIVGGNPDQRGVVATCSYEARQFGVHSAMPMKKAISLCPMAVILPTNMVRYKEMSEKVLNVYKKHTSVIEQVSIDEAYLAVKSGTGIHIAHRIRLNVREDLDLPLSIGVSVNKLLAKIACSLAKPNNVRAIWPEDVENILWPLPVRVIPGVGGVTGRKLNMLGISTVGDLAAFPFDVLQNVLGNNAFKIKEYALGRDDRVLELDRERKSLSQETTFPRDVHDPAIIINTLYELAVELGYSLRLKGIKARTITLKLRFPNLTIKTRSVTLPRPTDSDEKIYDTAAGLFSNLRHKPPWRLVGIGLSKLEKCGQQSLFPEDPDREKITMLMDSLRRKYGKDALFKGRRLM
ncbi:MAG TPA: DNA polymerase IV [Clostridia bacterium]|nr:DNA polymerase IV [Clostridia bacterium]